LGFLKPKEDDDVGSGYQEDRPDLDTNSQTSFVYNPYQNQDLERQRARLPIAKYRDNLLYLLENHQVVVVVGETGSGKSTQLPQYLLEAGYAEAGEPEAETGVVRNKMICVTEPRRIAVTSLAARVAEEKRVRLGASVGYSIRFDENFSREYTKIKFVTEGILIREMMGDPLLSNYSVIMLDEVHERTAQIDIIMGLLKKILKRRRDLKLIISSATVDAEYIRDFFNRGKDKSQKTGSATILSVEGRNYNVDVHYLDSPCPDYVKGCVETTIKIHEKEPPGDVLVFLTGMEEVDHCVNMLKNYTDTAKDSKHGLKMWITPMYGALAPAKQLKALRPAGTGYRKVVVATNIAETSITIEGVSHVVDCCFVKLACFNNETFNNSLIITEVSQASAEQRAGRAGRTRPGRCYRLCREKDFLSLPLNTTPELQRTDLSSAVLQLKALGIDNLVRFDFPSAPPSRNLISALELLFALGAIDEDGALTKPLGEQMSELPINPCLAKMLISSGELGCSQEIVTIVSMLQVENVFITASPADRDKFRIAKRKFEVAEGDLMTLLNIYYAFQKFGKNKHWCSSHYLRYKALHRATELQQQLFKVLKRFNVPIVSCHEKEIILKTIVTGLFPNAAYLHHSGLYKSIRGDVPLKIHPKSVLYTVKHPSYLVYTELVHTKDVYMRDVTAIDPVWLEVLAPHFYEKTRVSRNVF